MASRVVCKLHHHKNTDLLSTIVKLILLQGFPGVNVQALAREGRHWCQSITPCSPVLAFALNAHVLP
eukprot:2440322-Amphidinium_carterae.2